MAQAEDLVEAIESGNADAISFGRPFIANPDLPERFRLEAAQTEEKQVQYQHQAATNKPKKTQQC